MKPVLTWIRYLLWPPCNCTTNNIANFDPRFYDKNNAAVINPAHRVRPALQRDSRSGFWFVGEAAASSWYCPACRCSAANPAGSRRRTTIRSRASGVVQVRREDAFRASGGIFHNRVTLNDSTLLGGNPPFQPMVTVASGSVDNPAGAAGSSDSSASTSSSHVQHVDGQRSARNPLRHRRRIPDLRRPPRKSQQRERNINQLLPVMIQANPGVNIAALRPYKGYGGAPRVSENTAKSEYTSVQVSAERRYANGLKVSVAYMYGRSQTTMAATSVNALGHLQPLGYSSFDRAHVVVLLYIYDLPIFRGTLMMNLLGGWTFGLDVPSDGHAVLHHPHERHRRRGRRRQRPAGGHRRYLRQHQRQVLGRQRA